MSVYVCDGLNDCIRQETRLAQNREHSTTHGSATKQQRDFTSERNEKVTVLNLTGTLYRIQYK